MVLALFLNIDIVFLQETHCTNNWETDLFFKSWKGEMIHSYGSSFSRGVSILLSPRLSASMQKPHSDLEGRVVSACISWQGVSIKLVNIYGPNDSSERESFMQSLFSVCTTPHFILFGGDFNFVTDISLDKMGGNPTTGTEGAGILREISHIHQVGDIFRFLYPKTQEFTFTRTFKNETISSRLDRVYSSKTLLQCITKFNHVSSSFSDHNYIKFQMDLSAVSGLSYGTGYWKCNTSVLAEEPFTAALERLWYDELALRYPRDGKWWEFCKGRFKKLIISYSKTKRHKFRENVKEIETSIIQLKQHEKYEFIPGTFAPVIQDALIKLENLLLIQIEGQKVRSRVKHLKYDDKCSKHFLKKEVRNGQQKFITNLQQENVHLKTTPAILSACVDYYTGLFKAEKTCPELQDLFLTNLPQLDSVSTLSCEGLITYEECITAIGLMKNGKTPGLDGLPKEFYQKYFYLFGDDFVDMTNNCFTQGKDLPLSMRSAVLTLLCKDPNNSGQLKNWRPISLLNVDYKICSKVMSMRLKLVLSEIVSVFQTCSIPGRSISDNLHLFRNIIDYVNQKVMQLAFVNIDQEKAFDRVDHDYMFKVLDHFGFGPSFTQWIRLFYNNVYTSVLVNGFVSDPFNITRSVRQGCSLSPMLYILCLEPLALAIRRNPDIVGLSIPLSPEQIKVTQYADDLTVIITKEHSFNALLYVINTFCTATAAKINRLKSNGLFLGTWKNRTDSPGSFSWQKSIKLLGVWFSANGLDAGATWPKVLSNLKGTLHEASSRSKTLYGRALLINALALSKLWYVSSIDSLSNYWKGRFEKVVFSFLWNHGHEWLARNTLCLGKMEGGVAMVDISLKVKAFLLKHVFHLIIKFSEESPPPWVYFARYWMGIKLRNYNPSLFSNKVPNSIILTPFYQACWQAFQEFCFVQPNLVADRLSVKNIYRILILSLKPPPRVTKLFPLVQFRPVWRTIQIKSLSPAEKDLNFYCAHNILPVKAYLNKCHFGLASEHCYFCEAGRETLQHLFLDCPILTMVWNHFMPYLRKLCNHRLKFDFCTIVMCVCPTKAFFSLKHKILFWAVISIIKMAIWTERGRVKYDKLKTSPHILLTHTRARFKSRCEMDFNWLHPTEFSELWGLENIFVRMTDGSFTIIC